MKLPPSPPPEPPLFPGLSAGVVVGLVALVILPHFLNDIYLVYLNKTYVVWHQVDGRWAATLGIGKWVMWAWDFAVYLTLPILALVFYGKKGWVSWSALDLKTTHLAGNFAFGIALFAGIWGVMFLKALYLNPWLNTLLPQFGYYAFFYKPDEGLLVYLVMAIYIGFAAGILEEIVYRAFLIRTLERVGLSPWQAGGVALVVFTLIHASSGAATLVVALFAGGVFTLVYLVRRNIFPLIVAHSAIDVFWVSGYDERLFLFLKPLFLGT